MPEWLQDLLEFGTPAAMLGIGIWIGSINSDRKSFKKFMEEVREDIKLILLRLPEPKTVSGLSPVQLTEFGKKISKTIDASKWAKEQAPNLVGKVKGKEEFEIFDACITYVENAYKKGPEFTRVVRKGAYNMGTEPDNVLKVCNVELRDQVIKLLSQ